LSPADAKKHQFHSTVNKQHQPVDEFNPVFKAEITCLTALFGGIRPAGLQIIAPSGRIHGNRFPVQCRYQ
jgi:hypothetical protein